MRHPGFIFDSYAFMRSISSVICGIIVIAVFVALSGCVERQITIKSDPDNASLLINGVPVGKTPYTYKFVHYGVSDIMIKKDGYYSFRKDLEISAPFYQYFPLDLIFEVLPFTIHDNNDFIFELEALSDTDPRNILERANEVKKGLESIPPSPDKK